MNLKLEPEKIANSIDTLSKLDISKNDAYDQAINAFRSMGQIPSLVIDHPNLPLTMFRTRTHSQDNFWENIKDLGLPPREVITRFARCNKPGQAAFYCSENRPTSYMELLEYWVKEKKENILHVTVSGWTINNKLTMAIVTSPNPDDRKSKYDKQHGRVLDQFLAQFESQEQEAIKLFFKFMFDKFRKPAKDDLQTYMITTAYCDLLLNYPKSPIDSILYPSVPFEGNGINLAISENFDFAKNVKLELVARNTFQRIDQPSSPLFKEIEIIHAKNIDYSNGKILWQ